jgi:hypothetical protein
MIQRCTNPQNPEYHNYGERGVIVCGEWKTSFTPFFKDMGERLPGLSLERIDNSAGYSPQNCKWALRSDQNRNKRNNRILTYNGKSQFLTDWAKSLGINKETLANRLRRGWTNDEALSTPRIDMRNAVGGMHKRHH